jgi:hypothetical protein
MELAEVAGYGGRLILYVNPFSQFGFILQLCALTVAPALFSAGVYICLSKIVAAFGSKNSRISPRQYMYIFIPCDFVSLTLQGAGGGMASVAFEKGVYSRSGNHLLLAGLIAQVISLTIFMLLCVDFAVQVFVRTKRAGLDARSSKLLRSFRFRGFVLALVVSTLCIFVRSIYRIKEKQGGWTGPLMKNQSLFVIFEGLYVIPLVIPSDTRTLLTKDLRTASSQ